MMCAVNKMAPIRSRDLRFELPPAALLIIASILKMLNLFVQDFGHVLSNHSFLIYGLLAIGEFLIALILISRAWTPFAEFAAGFLFLLFAFASLLKAMHGDTSCGCLGAVSVSPSIMVFVDIGCASLLLLQAFTSSIRLRNRFNCRILLLCSISLLAVFGGIAGVELETREQKNTFSLRSDSLVGKRFFVLEDVPGGEQINAGRWDVLLVQSECEKCKRLVEKSLFLTTSQGPCPRKAIIDLSGSPLEYRGNVAVVVLSSTRKWNFDAPILAHINDNKVESVSTVQIHPTWVVK